MYKVKVVVNNDGFFVVVVVLFVVLLVWNKCDSHILLLPFRSLLVSYILAALSSSSYMAKPDTNVSDGLD